MLKRCAVWIATLLAVTIVPSGANAQVPIDPTATPVANSGGWVGGLNVVMLGLAVILIAGFTFGYMKFSGRFRAAEGEPGEAILRPGRPAPRVEIGAVAPRPPMPPPQAATPAVAVAAPPAAPGTAVPPAQPTPAVAPAEPAASTPSAPPAPAAATAEPAPAPPAQPPAAAPSSEAPPPAPVPPAGEVEPDGETYDRVLKEQLEKGVDRRIAEGRAKSAAIRAARQKAGA